MKGKEQVIRITKQDVQILKYSLNHLIATTGQPTEYDELLRKLYSLEKFISEAGNISLHIQTTYFNGI